MSEPNYLTPDEVIEVIKELAPTCESAKRKMLAIEHLKSYGSHALLEAYTVDSFDGKRFQSKDELRTHLTNA